MDKFQFLAEWDQLLVKIAEVMNTSVDAIQSNAGEYLITFAKYQLISEIPSCIFGSAFISIIAAILIGLFDIDSLINGSFKSSKYIKIALIISAAMFLILFGVETLKYIISPEIYGIKELLRLVQ